jgi:two-component system invasion response regulator UvrY
MLSVLIADRHAVTRRGYRHFLEGSFTGLGCAEASTGQLVVQALAQQDWDLILLDHSLPDHESMHVIRNIRRRNSSVKILVVSALEEAQYAPSIFRAGAHGLMAKAASEAQVVTAVRTVLAGQRYMSPIAAKVLASYRRADPTATRLMHQILSNREFQVFCKLASGISLSRIADHLSLSVKTVSTYRCRVLEKMSLGCNADMTRYALRIGLID